MPTLVLFRRWLDRQLARVNLDFALLLFALSIGLIVTIPSGDLTIIFLLLLVSVGLVAVSMAHIRLSHDIDKRAEQLSHEMWQRVRSHHALEVREASDYVPFPDISDEQRQHFQGVGKTSPKNLGQFVLVCQMAGDVRVSVEQARALGYCDDVYVLRDRYFPGQDDVLISELIPFVEYHHRYWADASYLLESLLVLLGLITEDPYRVEHFHPPESWLPDL